MKGLIASRRGESLVESVISILLLSFLMLSVTTIISSALNISKRTVADDADTQDTINSAVIGNFSGSEEEITFSWAHGGEDFKAEIAVDFTNDGGFAAFYPIEAGTGP